MTGRSALCFVSLITALAALGCSDAGSDLGAGETCVRTAQCANGLACVEGRCTTDVGGIGGTVPDAGAAMDGAVMRLDGAVDGAMPDAGPGVDSGPVDMDAGSPDPDAGPTVTDAGTDAGPTVTDAGPDAG